MRIILIRASLVFVVTLTLDGSAAHAQAHAGDTLADVLQQARAAPRTPLPWPAFDITREILIVTAPPHGPTALAGDPNPPAEFRRASAYPGIVVRVGAPPDSLAGLQLARDWNGRAGAATVLGVSSNTAHTVETVVHEAFHTYQQRSGGTGAPMLALPLGDTLLALAVMDGWMLARALLAPDAELEDLVRRALAVRAARCRALGVVACTNLRTVEAYEGAARYVASLSLLGSERLAERVATDTASIYSVARPSLQGLARFHGYATGEIWLALLNRLEVRGWPDSIARQWQGGNASAPDQLMANALAWREEVGAVSAATTMASADGRAAMSHVRTELAAAQRRRSERVIPTPPATHSLVRVVLPGDLPIGMTMTPMRGGGRESRVSFGDNLIVVRQLYGETGRSAWAALAGKTIEVDGRPLRLDVPGEETSGRVALELPEIRVRLARATVKIAEKEVLITYLP